MNIYIATLEYKIVRKVEIITEQDMTDSEIQAEAYRADTEITEHTPASIIGLRRTLKASICKVAKIEFESDEFTEEIGKAIINKLITQGCFAPDGRLGLYPTWLSPAAIDRLVVFGLLRMESGGPETLNDVQYYRVGDW